MKIGHTNEKYIISLPKQIENKSQKLTTTTKKTILGDSQKYTVDNKGIIQYQ